MTIIQIVLLFWVLPSCISWLTLIQIDRAFWPNLTERTKDPVFFLVALLYPFCIALIIFSLTLRIEYKENCAFLLDKLSPARRFCERFWCIIHDENLFKKKG